MCFSSTRLYPIYFFIIFYHLHPSLKCIFFSSFESGFTSFLKNPYKIWFTLLMVMLNRFNDRAKILNLQETPVHVFNVSRSRFEAVNRFVDIKKSSRIQIAKKVKSKKKWSSTKTTYHCVRTAHLSRVS